MVASNTTAGPAIWMPDLGRAHESRTSARQVENRPIRSCEPGVAIHRQEKAGRLRLKRDRSGDLEPAQREFLGLRSEPRPARLITIAAYDVGPALSEIQNTLQLKDIDMLVGEPATQHVVRLGHDLDAYSG